MAVSSSTVRDLFKERKLPFIFSLALLLLLIFTFLLISGTSQKYAFYIAQSEPESILKGQTSLSYAPNPITSISSPSSFSSSPPPPQSRPRSGSDVVLRDVADDRDAETASIRWKLCDGKIAVDYIPCLDNWKAIKALRSRRHKEHRERHCPRPSPRCLVPLPQGYRIPVPWPKSREMVRLLSFGGKIYFSSSYFLFS